MKVGIYMTTATLNCDIFVRITTEKSQTIISLQGVEEISSAIQYFLLGLLVFCLSLVRLALDRSIGWIDEPLAWLTIAREWSKIYAIELAEVVRCKGLSETTMA